MNVSNLSKGLKLSERSDTSIHLMGSRLEQFTALSITALSITITENQWEPLLKNLGPWCRLLDRGGGRYSTQAICKDIRKPFFRAMRLLNNAKNPHTHGMFSFSSDIKKTLTKTKSQPGKMTESYRQIFLMCPWGTHTTFSATVIVWGVVSNDSHLFPQGLELMLLVTLRRWKKLSSPRMKHAVDGQKCFNKTRHLHTKFA